MNYILCMTFSFTLLHWGLSAEKNIAVSPTVTQQNENDAMIALRFPDQVELQLIVDFISKRTGMNIIYDKSIGNVRIAIKAPSEIPVSSLPGLLGSILQMNGLILVDSGTPGWKKIVTSNKLVDLAGPISERKGRLVITQVLTLHHTEPEEAKKVIQPFLTQPGGNCFDIPDSRILVITDLANNMERLKDLVKLVDQPQKKALVEFIPIQNLEVNAVASQITKLLKLKQPNKKAAVEILEDNRTNRLIIVGTKEQIQEIKKEIASFDIPLGVVTKIYQLQSVSPNRIDTIIKGLIGNLKEKTLYSSTIDPEAGLLIVSTTPSIHKRLAELKEQLDVASEEAQNPVKFYKLANSTASDVLATIRQLENGKEMNNIDVKSLQDPAIPIDSVRGGFNNPPAAIGQTEMPKPPFFKSNTTKSNPEDSNKLQPMQQAIQTQKARVVADVNTNTIIVVGPPTAQKFYEAMIKKLDKRRPQVMIECKIIMIDTSDNYMIGVDISGQGTPDANVEQWMTFGQFGLNNVNPNTGRMTLNATPGFNGALFSSEIADIIVHAVETTSRSKVMSAPRIVVNDNATGTLSSVNEQPVTSINASETVSTTSFSGYASAGTTIDITPHIAEGDHLQLEYSITLNSFDGQGSDGIPAPRQTVQTASKVTIPDGYTIIVGGLNRRDYSKSDSALPGLTQTPVLQVFPGLQEKKDATSTLFVFVRATILRDDNFTDLKYLSSIDMEKAELPSDMPHSEPTIME